MSDSALGGVDLGAAGDPVETSQANVMRKVGNKTEQKTQQPKQQQGQSPQKPKPPEPSKAGQDLAGAQQAPQQVRQQGQARTEQQWAQRPLQSTNPLLDAIESVPDAAWLAHNAASYVMTGMQSTQYQQVGRYSGMTAQLWEQKSAQARIAQALMTYAAYSPPGLVLRGLYDVAYSGGHAPVSSDPNEAAAQQMVGGLTGAALDPTLWTMAATGGLEGIPEGVASVAGRVGARGTADVAEKAGEEAATTAPEEVAPGGSEAAVKSPATPETTPAAEGASAATKAAQVAGKVAPRVAENLAYNVANDPNLNPQSFAWDLTLAILFGNGHMTPAARAMLRRMGPQWEELGNNIADRTAAKIAAQSGGIDEYLKNISDSLEAMKPSENLYGKVPEEQELQATRKMGQEGPGDIRVSETKKRNKALAKLGVESMSDLEDSLYRGTLSQSQVKTLMTPATRSALGIQYPMMFVQEGERPLVDPITHIDAMSGDMKETAAESVSRNRMFIDQAFRGGQAGGEKPLVRMWRSLIGLNRNSDLVNRDQMDSWIALLGDDVNNSSVQRDLTRAVEGDEELYNSMPPNQKMIVDQYRMINAALMRRAAQTGYRTENVPNWFARIPVAREGKAAGVGATDILKGERQRQRSLRAVMGIDDKGEQRIELRQRHQSIFDLNKEQTARQNDLVDQILAVDQQMKGVDQRDLMEIRRLNASMDPADRQEAMNRAKEMAAVLAPTFQTDFMTVASRALARQMMAIHAQEGMQTLAQTEIRDKLGRTVRAAISTEGMKDTAIRDWVQRGYRIPESPWFRDVLVHEDFAKLLDRSARINKESLTTDSPLFKKLLQTESQAVHAIMYSPMLHGMNMASRLGAAWALHPIIMYRYLTKDSLAKSLAGTVGKREMGNDVDHFLRSEAIRAGVVANSRHMNLGPEIYAAHADSFGDSVIGDHPGLTDISDLPASMLQKIKDSDLAQHAKPLKSKYDYINNLLWSNISDFGVMMYHVEKDAFIHSGANPAAASELAARRANSWMGHVAPEDQNPIFHQILRSTLFAPNWLRSWAELLTGIYRNTGFEWDEHTIGMHARNEVKTLMAFLVTQKMTGNVFNLAMSGHLQFQNQPENQDKIEITNPAMIRLAQAAGIGTNIDPTTGRDPKTGAVMTIENPFGRQMLMTETALGFESGHQGWSPEDILPGAMKELASRTSPLMNSAAALANLDLYSSLTQGNLVHLNPKEEWGPDDAAMAALYMTPLGYNAARGIQTAEGVYGTQPQPLAQQAIGGMKSEAMQALFTGLTGVNPPVPAGQKTRGTNLSDQDYLKIESVNQNYDNQMSSLQNEWSSGSITPDQFRQQYQTLTIQRATTLQAFYNNSPEYMGGIDGLVGQWESLYARPEVLNGDGTINEDVLLALQQQFRSTHTSAQMNALDSSLAKTEQKYPAVKAYKDSLNAYHNFQQQWATDNGKSVYSIISEAKQLSALYGTPGYYQYLGEHPDLMEWENAKRQWLRTGEGIMYGLFEGSSTSMRIAYDLGAAYASPYDIQKAGNLALPLTRYAEQQMIEQSQAQSQAAQPQAATG